MADTAITENSVPVRNDDVLFSEVADGTSLMDIESGNYFHFEATASDIWKHIDGEQSVGDICDRLVADFDVARDVCVRDTVGFLVDIRNKGLIALAH